MFSYLSGINILKTPQNGSAFFLKNPIPDKNILYFDFDHSAKPIPDG